MSSIIKRSVCPYDCPDACGLLVEISGGKAIKVSGDPEHHHTQGTLCPKMTNYERTVYSAERLSQPLLRTGKKGTATFEAITWDEAIRHITIRWQEIIAKHSAEAILPYSYAGTMGIVQRSCGEAFFHRLGASRLERTICSSAKGYGWSSVMGRTQAPHPREIQKSDFIILWGTNALATNIHLLHNVREAKKRGVAVWLVETYESPTAKIADKVVLVRPGSDGALALGLMHIMVREGWIDQEFIDQHVQGFPRFSNEILSDYTPEKVSAITGVSIGLLEEMAKVYGNSYAPFISLGSGLSRYGNGAMTVRTIVCLPAIVGAWAKPGGGLLAGVNTNPFAVEKVTRKDFLPKPTRIVNMNQLGDALTKLTDPPVMGLYVYNSNPAVVAPDQNKIIQGLLREDLFTVVHDRFMTDTARYADIILPCTTSLEHSDIYRAYGHYGIQRAAAIIPPVGQSKSNWETFQMLARAMSFSEPFFAQTQEEMIDQLLTLPSPLLEEGDLSKLSEGRPIELRLPQNYKTTFLTASGRIEIFNPQEAEPLPRYLPPHGDSAPFWLMNPPSLYSLNSSFNERPDLLQKKQAPYLLMNPVDAANKNLHDGQKVVAFNTRGEVQFILKQTSKVPQGVLVTEGLFWNKDALGDRTVNALTSQRLTDRAAASTLYDVKVDVRPA